MSLGSTIAIYAALRRLDTVAGLDEVQLNELAQLVEVLQAPRGTCLLSQGSKDTRVLFLLEGELKLEAADGADHLVCHTDAAALGPVSRLRPSRYKVTALSDVRYLMIEQSLLDRFVEHVPVGGVLVEEALMVASEPNELIDDSATHPLMFDVFDDLNHGRVVVPSDTDIAIRVGRALHAQGSDPTGIANTLAVCPAIALKVLRAAMVSNPNRGKIRGIKEAVVRLGSERAIELAVQCVLRESLRTRSLVVRKRMNAWWERTIRVAAMCKVLARTSERFDPEYAGLIGLLHSIAEPVLLGYADRHSDLRDAATLDNVVHENRAQLARILLVLWGLPREVVDAATLCNHWAYEQPRDADYTDILLVAQWHAMIGGPRSRRIPSIEEIPAFRRLGLQGASPELSLKIVEAGNNAIDRADQLLDA